MERLTDVCWKNLDPWECCGQDYYCKRGCHDKGGCTNGCIVPKLYVRLAAYEDTGLTPEEIKDSFTPTTVIIMAGQALGVHPCRLRELAEADKDGRCVVLPCKVGAYMIDQIFPERPRLMKNVRPSIVYVSKGAIYNMALETFESAVAEGLIIPASEEAERALQEMEGKKDGV